MGRDDYSLATRHLSSSIILELKFIEICKCCGEWRVGFVNRKKEKKGSVGPAES
jgi:hypothetical protein